LLNQTLSVYGDGQQKRCFCHIADVVNALELVMTKAECIGKVVNIGSSEEVSIASLAEKVIAQAKSNSKIQFIPYEQAFPDGGFEDMMRRVPSLERIKSLTGWSPIMKLNDIIRDVLEDRRHYLGMVKIEV
jgi:UDP-glucose 4-epimerase